MPEFKNVEQKHREVRHLSTTTQEVWQNQKLNPGLPHSDPETCEQATIAYTIEYEILFRTTFANAEHCTCPS